MPQTGAADINASTRFCAVFGHPIHHSASPAMQNAGIRALGLDWCYGAFDVHPESLHDALQGAKAMRFIGLNLTVPHKLPALQWVDELDASARNWGAVNTIRFEASPDGGTWQPLGKFEGASPGRLRAVGFNTDADALVAALREDAGLALRGRRVVVLGAGGAGSMAALRLAAEGVSELFLVNRTASRAEALATGIRERHPALRVVPDYPPDGPVDLVINTTSLGLGPDDPSPLDETRLPLKRAACVYDMIYRPSETPLLRAAKSAGCRVANGMGMLLHQGARALEIWSERPAPLEVMRRALREHLYGS